MARTKSKSQKVAQKAKERALALKAGKAAAASGSAAGGVKRSRFWRSKWVSDQTVPGGRAPRDVVDTRLMEPDTETNAAGRIAICSFAR